MENEEENQVSPPSENRKMEIEIGRTDKEELAEVNRIIAGLEAAPDPAPSVLANIRSMQKVRRGIAERLSHQENK